MTDQYAIQVSALSKIYPPDLKAVDGLDMQVKQGEIMALLGPNGAGKSTTIRVLSTLSGFETGNALVGGIDVDREPQAVRQAIGVVAQQTGVDYFLTGRENMNIQGHMYRMKKADIAARTEELAKYFELEKSIDKPVSSYSGGMARKLDIAMALIHRPSILFLDEPTLGLDIRSRKILWRHIEELNKNFGLTILLTTHYLEEADSLSHRVAIINNGSIQVCDTADALKNAIKGDSITIDFDRVTEKEQGFASRCKQEAFVQDTVWEGNALHLYVDNGASGVPEIMNVAGKLGIHIKSLALARPTLDDVFLKYTGNRIEGKQEEEGDKWWLKWAGKGGGNWKKWSADDMEEDTGEEWQGNEWVGSDGEKQGDWDESSSWGGNEWVNADGTPKQPNQEAATNPADDNTDAAGDPEEHGAESNTAKTASEPKDGQDNWQGNDWVDASGKQQGDWGNDNDWQGNEWVDGDGKPKEDWSKKPAGQPEKH